MNLELSEDQRLLKQTIDRLFADEYCIDQRNAFAREPQGWGVRFWSQLAELGILGLAFPERLGGLSGSSIDLMILMEAVGRALALEPYVATLGLGASAICLAANDEQKEALIPKIMAGTLRLSFAHHEADASAPIDLIGTTARRSGSGWVLSGRKRMVLQGDSADVLIVSARATGTDEGSGITLFLLPAGLAGMARHGFPILGGIRACDVLLDEVTVGPDAVLGEAGKALPAIEGAVGRAIAMLCAEAVGCMAAAHEATVDYLKTRKQFGAPIGHFQALQHRAVDMFIALEQARSMALFAAMMVDAADGEQRSRALSAAKIQIGRSARFIGQQAVQLHGGIGMTTEYAIGHYFQRLTAIEMLFGSADQHLQRLVERGGMMAAW